MKRRGSTSPPTEEQFRAYQAIFDHFNRSLFADSLPSVLLNFSRHARSYGFFAPERWESAKQQTHEISLNPQHLLTRPPIEVASTLAHEMVHLWHWEHGKHQGRGYHDRQWADKMDEIGLAPSHTGKPGGRRVGFRMTHYIKPGGAFERAFHAMPREHLLPWQGRPEPEAPRGGGGARNKIAYRCPQSHGKVWGKPDLQILCGICHRRYEPER
jgi:hypothetical protein